jgi:sugar phosphate permease
MMLIGAGCSPVLMTSFYIFARTAPSHLFGTLAGLIVGIGSLGNLAASAPLSFFLELIGWRSTAVGLGLVTILVAATLYFFLTDPPKAEASEGDTKGGLRDLLTNWKLYPILAIALVNYAPSAAIRGSWGGAYLAEIYQMDVVEIGRATAFMAIAMICGSLFFGPIDRIVRSRKTIVLTGVATLAVMLTILWLTAGTLSPLTTTLLFVAIGFFGSTYGQVMNHGRSLMPAHLTGRGVTLINLFSMGGASLAQIATARIFVVSHETSTSVSGPFAAVFAFLTCCVILGAIAYTFSQDKRA